MTKNEALQFLLDHQPLPPTREISDALIQEFDKVRKLFALDLDERCVRPLLNSFGDGDGHGVYQLVEDTILLYSEELVVSALKDSLRNPSGSVRYWSALIAANYLHRELVEPLFELFKEGNLDERIAVVIALEGIGSREAQEKLVAALSIKDIEDEVQSMIHEVLKAK